MGLIFQKNNNEILEKVIMLREGFKIFRSQLQLLPQIRNPTATWKELSLGLAILQIPSSGK